MDAVSSENKVYFLSGVISGMFLSGNNIVSVAFGTCLGYSIYFLSPPETHEKIMNIYNNIFSK